MNHFLSAEDPQAKADASTFCAVVPRAITAAPDLLQILAAGLRFPYFGKNWNALFDCLCDLEWLSERRVMIMHEDIPPLPPDQLQVYLKVLVDAVESWQLDPGKHELVVVFPDSRAVPSVRGADNGVAL